MKYYKFRMLAIAVAAIVCLFATNAAMAFDRFVIKDIQINGLNRISLGTAFTYLPLKVGETMDDQKATKALKELYKTGFFEDVKLSAKDQVLVIDVVERPSISSIKIFGNKEINSDDLTKALKKVGLAEGLVFNRSILDQVEQELQRQYFALGKYGVKIKTKINDLPRNRVNIQIDVEEGDAASIKSINIIGAKSFTKQKLLDQFQLTTPWMFSGMVGSDSYSKQLLTADQETLRSYYLDRGYINFSLDSTSVSLSPDRREVYITLNITEGEQFKVKGVKLSGDLKVDEKELEQMIELQPGDVFSRKKLVASSEKITQRLGIEGYAFAHVNAIPDIDQASKLISITFFVDPGKRVYVRRINISGNTKTQDEVIRREMRQMEGGWVSTPLIERSKVRLQRLGYFEDVKVETKPVPGTTDQVDIDFKVTEGSTGNFTAGLGYGQTGGFLFNTSVTLNNFLGTGKRISAEVNSSKINQIYSFNYFDPYFTDDGVSRGIKLFSRATDASAANLADYNTDSLGAAMDFGVPLTEYTNARIGLGYEKTDITLNELTAPRTYRNWIDEHGKVFDEVNASASLSYDSRNRAIFPDSGYYAGLSGKVAFPGADLSYYKASLQQNLYIPIVNEVSLMLAGDVSYGAGYGKTARLPFFENYYLGGYHSLRGFRGNTVGPRDERGDAVGGFRRVTAKTELFFPSPFTDEPSRTFKFGLFLDAGKLYAARESAVLYDVDSDPEAEIHPRTADIVAEDSRLRTAYGISAVWITPVGALSFTFARPIKYYKEDDLEFFSFNIGAPF